MVMEVLNEGRPAGIGDERGLNRKALGSLFGADTADAVVTIAQQLQRVDDDWAWKQLAFEHGLFEYRVQCGIALT